MFTKRDGLDPSIYSPVCKTNKELQTYLFIIGIGKVHISHMIRNSSKPFKEKKNNDGQKTI